MAVVAVCSSCIHCVFRLFPRICALYIGREGRIHWCWAHRRWGSLSAHTPRISGVPLFFASSPHPTKLVGRSPGDSPNGCLCCSVFVHLWWKRRHWYQQKPDKIKAIRKMQNTWRQTNTKRHMNEKRWGNKTTCQTNMGTWTDWGRELSIHIERYSMKEIQRKRATLESRSGLMEWKEHVNNFNWHLQNLRGTARKEIWQLNQRQWD